MTILFPGRKAAPPSGYNPRTFRDAVVRCIATRVDKRSIVHDYAVSPDNVVFVPTQEEAHWAEDSSDWSAYVTLRLYTPDFVEGRMTGNAILHAMWQMYQDVSRNSTIPASKVLRWDFRVKFEQFHRRNGRAKVHSNTVFRYHIARGPNSVSISAKKRTSTTTCQALRNTPMRATSPLANQHSKHMNNT